MVRYYPTPEDYFRSVTMNISPTKIEPWIVAAVREVAERLVEIDRGIIGRISDLAERTIWEREVSKILQAHYERAMRRQMVLVG